MPELGLSEDVFAGEDQPLPEGEDTDGAASAEVDEPSSEAEPEA
jgi:hypothetical protein